MEELEAPNQEVQEVQEERVEPTATQPESPRGCHPTEADEVERQRFELTRLRTYDVLSKPMKTVNRVGWWNLILLSFWPALRVLGGYNTHADRRHA